MKTIFSLFVIIVASTIATSSGIAQQEMPRIGLLSGVSSQEHAHFRQEFLQGLEELGYVGGKNILIEYRYAERKADRLPKLAEELVRLNVALIVAGGPTPIGIALKATKKIPIVMVSGGNVLGRGFVKSLTEPGGNATGLRGAVEGIEAKRLELMRETVPSVSRVTLLNARRRKSQAYKYERAGKELGIAVTIVDVRKREDYEGVFERIEKLHPDGMITIRTELSIGYAREIAEFANRNKFVSMFESEHFAQQGGLMFYGIDFRKMWRRAPVYVDKILRGGNPAVLPVEPPELSLVVNLKTAEEIGLRIPPEILLEAKEVIK